MIRCPAIKSHRQIADEVGDNSDDEARAGVSAGMSHSPVSPEI
jgi:hypothetical protein